MEMFVLRHSGESCGICSFDETLGIFDTKEQAIEAAKEFVSMEEFPSELEVLKGETNKLWVFTTETNKQGLRCSIDPLDSVCRLDYKEWDEYKEFQKKKDEESKRRWNTIITS